MVAAAGACACAAEFAGTELIATTPASNAPTILRSIRNPSSAQEKGRGRWVTAAPAISIEGGCRSGVLALLGHDRTRILPLGGDVAVDELDDRDRRRVRHADAG